MENYFYSVTTQNDLAAGVDGLQTVLWKLEDLGARSIRRMSGEEISLSELKRLSDLLCELSDGAIEYREEKE